jgi:hypothetical protein
MTDVKLPNFEMPTKDEIYCMVNTLYRMGLIKTATTYDNSRENYKVAEDVIIWYNTYIQELNNKKN